jgi:hypothetical protein
MPEKQVKVPMNDETRKIITDLKEIADGIEYDTHVDEVLINLVDIIRRYDPTFKPNLMEE